MIFIVVLSILVLISLVGNTLVILTVLINKPMQTTLNYLLVNLAVADMMFASSIGIQYVMMPFIAHPEGEAGRYLCTFVTDGNMAWVGGAVSILCLVYITVERYFAIIHPLRQRGRFTKRRLKVFVVLGWSFAILMQTHGFIEIRYYRPDLRLCKGDGSFGYVEAKVGSLAWMVLAGIVPVSIMTYMYSRVVHHLWFKPVGNLDASQRASLRYRKQVAITLITVSLIYAVSWIPNLTAYVLKSWDGVVMGSWYDKSGTLSVTFNSCINPVLYSMRIKSFREHLRDMLLCKKKQTARGQAAVVHVGPATGQPINGCEEPARNTAASTPFSFSSGKITSSETPLNEVESRRKSLTFSDAAADIKKIETATCTTFTESKQVTGEAGTACPTCPQKI
ncbi:QRFP-like peptide receptor [Oculina patagonica]